MDSNVLEIIGMVIIAYLLGSIPSGVWIGKLFYHVDIRRHGSGNIGTTNTYRVLGPIAGSIVLVMDISKGALATLLPTLLNNNTINPLVFGLFAILGHTFSIFDKFKGGKAIATSAGMLLAYRPILFLIAAGLWISLILITSTVSFASIFAFITITIIIYFTHDIFLSVLATILCIFIIYRHRENIKRMLNGTESKVNLGFPYWFGKK
ncbi:glycerol-3-phosphate 1-O-acyltransferase PlsY [Lentilactobacillus sp. Marseille-Q4993]|uniref:glycerol-3-phosphate 1-O-acyltransferase PlsY n=1 Tax=Lentilactobacillus sp. Marseille-Q4993 TaxID=3039492 RepID=UPI0024BCE1EA|nr:glycerol-3-phosphate 1-O-acyltransferase PlsY [Lentilactobacillus sp. Marseille-Q4993]